MNPFDPLGTQKGPNNMVLVIIKCPSHAFPRTLLSREFGAPEWIICILMAKMGFKNKNP